MCHHVFMPDEPRTREYIPLRLDTDIVTHVRALADRECEGNLSMMIRRLIREALAARPEVTP